MSLLRAPDGADQRVKDVVHHHAPSGDVTRCRMDFLRDIGEGRTGAWISARHAAVTNTREQHGDHGDEDCGDDMSASAVAQNARKRTSAQPVE